MYYYSILNTDLIVFLYFTHYLQPPEDPSFGWDFGLRYWCADYYRDACPQELWRLQDTFAEARNMSEDCLHLNIFAPNVR